MIQRISIAPLYLVTAVILSGCVTGHQHIPLAESSNVRQATASYNAAHTQIHVSGSKVSARIHPEASTFQRVIWHLQPQWTGSTLMQPARGMLPARGLVKGHPVRWQPYSDPDIKWVNYFNDGLGIHYYPRAAYGFPQSAGCVEEPLKAARITYGLLHYGVPVTVSKAGMVFQ